MEEYKLHDLIIKDKSVQKDICMLLDVNFHLSDFVHEDRYINGIIADFSLLENNEVKAIIECKGSNLTVTDYVRGIGQTLQYSYFCSNNLSSKGYRFSRDAKAVLCFPASLIKKAPFNIGMFQYPEGCILIEINDNTRAVRTITDQELKRLFKNESDNLITISQYYIRDNRLYELYIVLKHMCYLKLIGKTDINRREMEFNFFRKLETHNNKNWRNAFISLSSLGFLNSENLPTNAGFKFGSLEYEDFVVELYDNYLKPYFVEVFNVFEKLKHTELILSNKEICELIRDSYRGKDIVFLTESEGRYMSSWLNLMRDDIGCINFESRSTKRDIVFNPIKLNKDALKEAIKENSIGYRYINKYYALLNKE